MDHGHFAHCVLCVFRDLRDARRQSDHRILHPDHRVDAGLLPRHPVRSGRTVRCDQGDVRRTGPDLRPHHRADRVRRMVRPRAGRHGHRRLDLLPHCQGRREEPGAGHHLRGIRHLSDLHQRLRRRLGHRHRRDPLPDHGPPRRAQARGRSRLHPVHRRRHVDQQRDVRAVRRLLPGL